MYIGLTGNMGCGKSTVASLLAKLDGVRVYNCDDIAKNIIASRDYAREITDVLGSNVFTEDAVDYAAIARIFFADESKKKAFEAIIHPRVWEYVEIHIALTSENYIHIVEAATLFENGSADKFDAVIVATCSKAEQYYRLIFRRKMTVAQINERLSHQLSLEEKESLADYVIDTSCSFYELEERVEKLHAQLLKVRSSENGRTNSSVRG